MAGPRDIVESERMRLEACALEPIRTPGSIQSHGILLVLAPDSRTIAIASENCAQGFQVGPDAVLGVSLDALIGAESADAVRDIADGTAIASNPLAISLGGREWEVIAHRTRATGGTGVVVVEFEPAPLIGHSPAASTVFAAIRKLSQITTVPELRRDTVRVMAEVIGFDRVMLYHFHPDGHGEIVAEEHAAGIEPYLGLHFPASDIPPQARQLYLTKLSRTIADTAQPTSALLGTAGAEVDLSGAELRGVSPTHIRFMQNMGQVATVSFSLVRDGVLVGMITCAHRTARRLPYLQRSALEMLADQLALQLDSMERIERLTASSRARELRSVLVRQFAESGDHLEGLLDGAVGLLDVVPADGAACSIDGVQRSVGIAPPIEQFDAWLTNARATAPELIAPTDSLGVDHPHLAAFWGHVAGVLIVWLGESDYIALFRQEVTRTIDWLSDLSADNRSDALSPRTSFSSWTQSVKGTAAPWGATAFEARELGRDLEGAMLRRTESHLAMEARSDVLTGLPNRRFLQERLTQRLNQRPLASTALLFIDLDRFKSVNDSLGHDVGDSLLVSVAERLAAVARENDTVARLGGDEFVLVCADMNLRQAESVAARILTTFREPLEIGDHTFVVSASIGIAVAVPGHTAADLIKLADLSMYRAKASGGDRASA